MKTELVLTQKTIAEQKAKALIYEQAAADAEAEWNRAFPKLSKQIAVEDKNSAKLWSDNEASRKFCRAFNAAVKGSQTRELIVSDPVTGKPRATDAFFSLATRIFSLCASKRGSSGSNIHTVQRTVLAVVTNALRTGDAQFFEDLARAIRGHNPTGRPHEANVLWLAKELGTYPLGKGQISRRVFRKRYKERYGLVIDTRYLVRICNKHGIQLQPGEPGRPKTRTAEK